MQTSYGPFFSSSGEGKNRTLQGRRMSSDRAIVQVCLASFLVPNKTKDLDYILQDALALHVYAVPISLASVRILFKEGKRNNKIKSTRQESERE